MHQLVENKRDKCKLKENVSEYACSIRDATDFKEGWLAKAERKVCELIPVRGIVL